MVEISAPLTELFRLCHSVAEGHSGSLGVTLQRGKAEYGVEVLVLLQLDPVTATPRSAPVRSAEVLRLNMVLKGDRITFGERVLELVEKAAT
jgi:hypothetical protein